MSKNTKYDKGFIEEFKKAFEEAYGIKPADVHAQNTLRTDHYRAYLWRLFLGSVNVVVPDNWSIDFVRAVLFWGGGIGVTELKGVVVPYAYSIKTRNKWHYPITVQATGQLQQDIPERTIAENTEIIYLESAEYPDAAYACGVQNLIDIYAEKLANCDGSIDVNLLNTRTPWIFGVDDEKDKSNMQALFNRIMAGAPAVYYKLGGKPSPNKRDLPILKTPAKENFISLDVQDAKRSIINEYLTAIGINNANTDKKERLITGEVEANDVEIASAVNLWQDNVNRCIKKVKAMFPDFFSANELKITFLGAKQDAERGDNEPSRVNGDMGVEDGENAD